MEEKEKNDGTFSGRIHHPNGYGTEYVNGIATQSEDCARMVEYYPGGCVSKVTEKINAHRLHIQTFHEDGSPVSRGIYLNGVKDGYYEEWSPDGVLTLSANYSDGLLHGERLEYYDDGLLKSSSLWSHGKKTGLETLYRDAAERPGYNNIIVQILWTDGKRDGIARWVDTRGNLMKVESYADGVPDGVWEWYDHGALDKWVRYDAGILVDEVEVGNATEASN